MISCEALRLYLGFEVSLQGMEGCIWPVGEHSSGTYSAESEVLFQEPDI